MRVDVLNPRGRDAPVDYRDGVTPPSTLGHPPISYWAYAAATGGRFHQNPWTVTAEADAVLVLLRRRGWTNLRALEVLKARGLRIFVTWKESGSAQLAGQLRWPWRRALLRRTLALADGALATTEPGVAHYREYGLAPERVHFLPTPYPFDVPGWDFARPLAERSGLVIGTRQFHVPSRRHAEALRLGGAIARRAGCRLSVFNPDGAAGRRRVLAAVREGVDLHWIERRLPYPDFLRELASHRLVVQRDIGWVPGQIAGDALMCGVVNLGGNGAVQRVAFPDFAEPEADEGRLLDAAVSLLGDDARYGAAAADGRRRAAAGGLSFAATGQRLAALLESSR